MKKVFITMLLVTITAVSVFGQFVLTPGLGCMLHTAKDRRSIFGTEVDISVVIPGLLLAWTLPI